VAVIMLAVPGCSSDDDVLDVPTDQVVEAGLNDALTTTVVPLVNFIGGISDLLAASKAGAQRAEAVCPDTSGWCVSGTVSCTVTDTGLHFDFDECQVVTGDGPMTVDGDLDAIPGTTVYLTLTNLFINNSPAMSGTGTINLLACSYFLNVQTADSAVYGIITVCDSDEYPTGEFLNIAFDDFLITIVFNGTNIATATATQGETPVADCTIDLDSDPLTSSCNGF